MDRHDVYDVAAQWLVLAIWDLWFQGWGDSPQLGQTEGLILMAIAGMFAVVAV